MSKIVRKILSNNSHESADEIQLQLRSRALLHLDSKGEEFCTTITAAPTPVNLRDHEDVEKMQPEMNLILDRLSRDRDTIIKHLSPIAIHDSFAKGLLEIYEELPDSHLDKIILSLNRHDFMYATPDPTAEEAFLDGHFKLVEYNLIASSLGPFGERVYQYHRNVLNRANVNTSRFNYKVNNLRGFSEGLQGGYELYNRKYQCDRKCVVALVDQEPPQFNYFDQQLILNELENNGVPTIRCTPQGLVETGKVVDGRYYVDGREVAVFYFRTFYDPSHFKSADHWRVRREMEYSAAVTVPCVRHQIVNMKLFQMLLSQRNFLEKYTTSPQATEDVLRLVCDTLPLTLDEEGNRNAQLGIDYPNQYVLKPQREGGGHNIWDLEMREKLISLSGNPARAQFILMKRITPPILRNKFIRRGVISEELNTVSEFGFFSVFCTSNEVLVNKVVGPLVRTKSATENEGGVAVGISVLDSPLFVESSNSHNNCVDKNM